MSELSSCAQCGQPHGLWATDRLTLVLDRWGWDDRATEALAAGGPTALLVVDVDNFKRVNDRHGHVAGDEVLKSVADTLRQFTRKSDLVGRYGGQGGDEFLVLLPNTTMDNARAIAERVRQAVREMTVHAPTPDGTASISAVTVSIGVSVATGDTDLQALVVAADAALRNAKKGGRNRVRTSAEPRGRAVPWRLVVMGACVAGAMLVVAVTDGPPPRERGSAAEPPSTTPPTSTPSAVTVPTTVTATTVVHAPAARQPRTPARKRAEDVPTTTTRPCIPCDMFTSAVNEITPFMPR
jgi:diguanylate cyclase (GGDEF)-like protein